MKNFGLIFFLSFGIAFLTACKDDSCVEKAQSNFSCIEIYKPVCGCNNKTYDNSCYAEANGILEYTEGGCGVLR